MVFHSVKLFLTLAILLFVSPTSASAHIIGGDGYLSGIIHPLLGLDHLLAMIAVGVIAVKIGGRALWSVPLAFLSAMIAGGILSVSDIHLPLVETTIAISILLFGSFIAISEKLSPKIAIASVAFFALFHGHAHGTEIVSTTSPFLYVGGFISATALLHIAGIVVGLYAQKTTLSLRLLKTSGFALTAAGLILLLGISL